MNSPEGVIIEVYQAGETAPTYTAVLPDQTLTMEASRVLRTELPAELGETTFYDETTKPGRWTLLINDTQIDLMQRAMIIDEKTSIAPAEER